MARPRKTPAATPAAPVAAAATPALDFQIDWTKMSTRDLVLFQSFALISSMSEEDKNNLVLRTAPMMDRMIVGGMPDLPIERFGDIVQVFFAKMQERGAPKN